MKLKVTKGELIISIHLEMADGQLPGGAPGAPPSLIRVKLDLGEWCFWYLHLGKTPFFGWPYFGKRSFFELDLSEPPPLKTFLGERYHLVLQDLGRRSFLELDLGERSFQYLDQGETSFFGWLYSGKRFFFELDLGEPPPL